MEKLTLQYVKSEVRERDSGEDLYHIFRKDDGMQRAIKDNKITRYFLKYNGKFVPNNKYDFFLKLGGCLGVSVPDRYMFLWGARVIMNYNGQFYEVNPRDKGKPLTTEKAQLYAIRFFGSNGVTL
jgi:hypothetical protein